MAGYKNSAYFFIIINKSLTSTSINLTYTFSIFVIRRLFMSKNLIIHFLKIKAYKFIYSISLYFINHKSKKHEQSRTDCRTG